jgi:glycosyltransferase involved in cell wall biosynthesis
LSSCVTGRCTRGRARSARPLGAGRSGGERAVLEQKARELNLSDRVRFTGYITEEEKIELYRTADIFVFPTLLEGFGMVATEAMACGCPVIASDVASLPEIIEEGKSGYLAPLNNVSAWQEAIMKIVSSPKLRTAMSERSKAIVAEKFSWDRSARQQIEVMEKIKASKTL